MSPPNLAPHLIFLPEILPETEFLIQRPRPLLRNRPLLRLRRRRGLPLPLRQRSLYVLSERRRRERPPQVPQEPERRPRRR